MPIMDEKEKDELKQSIYEAAYNGSISIAEIVCILETAKNCKIDRLSSLNSGMAIRMTAMFGSDKDIIKNTKRVLPLVIEDLIQSGALGGTEFANKYLKPKENS